MTSIPVSRPAVLWMPTTRILALGAVTILLFLCFGLINPTILSVGNIRNIFIQASYLAIFAAAQTVVIVGRGLDLSLGSTVSVISVCTALALTMGGGSSVVFGIAAGIATGVLVGLCNGVGVAYGKINPFIMTLAMLNILVSVATTVSGGFPVQNLPEAFVRISTFDVAGVPGQIVLTVLLFVGLDWLLRRSAFGHSLFLIGSNARAAAVAGISVKRLQCLSYVIGAAITAFGAILLTARTGSGEPNLGGDLTLGAIAAAVLGGIKMRGGEGTILSPIIGALLVTIFTNGLNLLSVNGFIQQIVIGAVILTALAFDREKV